MKFIYHKNNMIEPKPSPKQIEYISKEYNPNKITYIGDNCRDYEFALNSGINFLGVLTGIEERIDFLNAGLQENHIFKDIHNALFFMLNGRYKRLTRRSSGFGFAPLRSTKPNR